MTDQNETPTPDEVAANVKAQMPELPPNPRAGGDFLDKLAARLPKDGDALASGPIIQSRRVSFIFDGSAGAPGFFVDEEGNYYDLELTCKSLSTADELEALQGVTHQVAAPFALAKHSLEKIEGKDIPSDQRDLIWEAIGPVGRQLCIMANQQLGNVSESAMGKYRASFTVL